MFKIPELLVWSLGISDQDLLEEESHVPHLAWLWGVKPGQLCTQRWYGTQKALRCYSPAGAPLAVRLLKEKTRKVVWDETVECMSELADNPPGVF